MQRPFLQYSLLCLGYDETKGPPTLQNVIHELPLTPFPYQFPPGSGLFLVNGWLHLPEQSQCRVELSCGQHLVLDESFPLRREKESDFQISLLFLEELNFPQPGTYLVRCWLDDQLHSEYPLLIQDFEHVAP